MTKEEIYAFLNANQFCFLATDDNGQPRVRGMAHYRADENGIIFHSGKMKDLAAQIERNPKVEVCAFDPNTGVQVRVTGTAVVDDDLALKQEIVANRPFLQPIIAQIGYESFLVFKVVDCTATVWTMATNMEPKTFVKL